MEELVGAARGQSPEPVVARRRAVSLRTRPPRRTGVVVGLTQLAIVLAAAAVLALRVVQQPITLASFAAGLGAAVLLGVAAVVAYWTYSCFSLSYAVERGALTVVWGALRHVIPLSSILKVVPAEAAVTVRGVSWPGHHIGQALVPGVGPTLFYATRQSPPGLVYLLTAEAAFALAADYDQVQSWLPDTPTAGGITGTPRRHYWWPFELSLWRDRSAILVGGLALAANLLLFAYVAHAYPSLPEFLSLHYTATGTVDRIGYRSEILRLPVMALVVWGTNGLLAMLLHGRERLAAYLCLLAALLVQGLFLVALAKIVG